MFVSWKPSSAKIVPSYRGVYKLIWKVLNMPKTIYTGRTSVGLELPPCGSCWTASYSLWEKYQVGLWAPVMLCTLCNTSKPFSLMTPLPLSLQHPGKQIVAGAWQWFHSCSFPNFQRTQWMEVPGSRRGEELCIQATFSNQTLGARGWWASVYLGSSCHLSWALSVSVCKSSKLVLNMRVNRKA